MRTILSGLTAATTALLLGAALGGCATGPTTKAEVCTAFDDLGNQLFHGNGIIGNPLFHKADELGNLAGRYPGPPDLTADASALHKIADSSSTSGDELEQATAHVANLCGHPLSLAPFLGH